MRMERTHEHNAPDLFLLRTPRGAFIVNNDEEGTVFTLKVNEDVTAPCSQVECPIYGLAQMMHLSIEYRKGKVLLGFVPFTGKCVTDGTSYFVERGFTVFYVKEGKFTRLRGHDGIYQVLANWQNIDKSIKGLGYG